MSHGIITNVRLKLLGGRHWFAVESYLTVMHLPSTEFLLLRVNSIQFIDHLYSPPWYDCGLRVLLSYGHRITGPINSTGLEFLQDLGHLMTEGMGDPYEMTYLFQWSLSNMHTLL